MSDLQQTILGLYGIANCIMVLFFMYIIDDGKINRYKIVLYALFLPALIFILITCIAIPFISKVVYDLATNPTKCKHEYKPYAIETYYNSYSHHPKTQYNFVCTVCHKTLSITKSDILEKFNQIKDDYNKNIALGHIDNGTNKLFKLSLPVVKGDTDTTLSGECGFRLVEYYKTNYNVDITKLNYFYNFES